MTERDDRQALWMWEQPQPSPQAEQMADGFAVTRDRHRWPIYDRMGIGVVQEREAHAVPVATRRHYGPSDPVERGRRGGLKAAENRRKRTKP